MNREIDIEGRIINKRKKTLFREYTEALFLAILMAVIIRTFIVQAYKIPSGSMIPTLEIGDHILVNKFIFGIKFPFTDSFLITFGRPQRNDVIVFKYPEDESKDFIKRVIGLPGDIVDIKDKRIYINGKPLDEPYVIHKDPAIIPKEFQPRDNLGPIIVPQDSYFMMGDNRDQSLDSRFWGFVKLNKIRGKAFGIYFSCKEKSSLSCLLYLNQVRWDRLGKFVR